MIAVTLFIITYLGIALGKVPGLVIDRVGILILGAIGMVAFGVVTTESAFRSIDLSTILLLYSLMIISAQFRIGGFYSWIASRIVMLSGRPQLLLLTSMLTSAFLSGLLANDIICFAFTPVLSVPLIRSGLNPLPFLIGLAVSSNIGSAATIIGNPQNMLIGQIGRLDFRDFFLWCSPPSVITLFGSYLIILWVYRNRMFTQGLNQQMRMEGHWPVLNKWQSTKGIAAICILIALFFSPVPRELSAIVIAGVLLCSRRLKTRDILSLVDWHLITLFCALFIVIHGLFQSGYLTMWVHHLAETGVDLHNLFLLALLSTLLSNLFSNVPATMLLVPFLDPLKPMEWYTLAVSSTFAGNLFLLGSIANLIVVEQASQFGIRITFKEHAAVGIPVTLLSLIVLAVWILL